MELGLKRLFFIIVICYCVALLGFYLFQERLIFQSVKLKQDFLFQFDKSFTEINLKTEDNAQLNGVYFEVKNPKGIILYFHGNRDNLVRWGKIASELTKYNYNVLVVDYRDYGKSTGAISETKLYKDAQQWYAYVNKSFDESKIIVYGRSLGSTFATYVAHKNNPKQLILEAPFNTLGAVPKYWFPFAPYDLLLKYKFNSQLYIKDVHSKITIFHGRKDRVIPFKLGEKLYKSAPKDKASFIEIKGGSHNNLDGFERYHEVIKEILD